MKGQVSSILFMILVSGSMVAQSGIDHYILQKMEENNWPGVAISYIKDGRIAIAKGYGLANIEEDIPFTQHSILEVASISKTITATAVMILWEQGLFDLDDPINAYLPFPIINPFFPNDTITIRMLLNHRSSLGFGYSVVNDEVVQISVLPGEGEDFDTFLRKHFVPGGIYYTDTLSFSKTKPGTGYSYSNYAYTVLAYIVELLSGQSFSSFLEQNIFEPLCMTNTYCHYTGQDTNLVARSYHGQDTLVDFPLWEWSEYPGVGIKSTVMDISKLMLMHLNYGSLDDHRVLDSMTEVEMRKVQYVREETYIPQDGDFLPIQLSVCLGMEQITEHLQNDQKIYGKSGQSKGICTRSYFFPEKNELITVFANGNIGDGINLPLVNILLKLHFLDSDSLTTLDLGKLDCNTNQPCQKNLDDWKIQSEWPINAVPMRLGTVERYSREDLNALLQLDDAHDASLSLAQQLIVAKLNVAQGSELAPVLSSLHLAMEFIGENRLPFDFPIEPNSKIGQELLELADTLFQYNQQALNNYACSIPTSVEELPSTTHEGMYFSISPNPVTESARISFTQLQPGFIKCSIYSQMGIELKTLHESIPEGMHQFTIETKSLPAGIYYINLQNNAGATTKKLIVQH